MAKKKDSLDGRSVKAEEARQTRSPTAPADTNGDDAFPIVGLGASAGGLKSFEIFFTHMPPDSGMAFILVQHLDPNRESMLVELVQRYTRMAVVQVQDEQEVEPNHVYIIPPNRDMALMHGAFYLMEPVAPRGLRLPIDTFFRSLARDQGERAICIILSGTGTDGTLGLKAIKEEGGMAMVQDPASSSYDGMPHSAINTGLVDYVLPPEEMPEQLINYVQHTFVPGAGHLDMQQPQAGAAMQKIFILLRNQTGHDFSQYKPNTTTRRIQRRMTVNQIKQIDHDVRHLQRNPLEVETLFKELLIGVTAFFRDSEAFTALETKAIPRLFENRPDDRPIRIWVPGCATGEEAYSIAIFIMEQMEKLQRSCRVQIFATDVDAEAVEKGRQAFYPDNIAADVSPERLQRFFDRENHGYRVKKMIREMVLLAVQNVIQDPPFSRLDLISCRNLLIYLNPELQKKVIPRFHYALRPGGFLFLGTAESLGEIDRLFKPIDRKSKLFQRLEVAANLQTVLDSCPARAGCARPDRARRPPTARSMTRCPVQPARAEPARKRCSRRNCCAHACGASRARCRRRRPRPSPARARARLASRATG
jgi:two-component system CheB/CheR fusion protein